MDHVTNRRLRRQNEFRFQALSRPPYYLQRPLPDFKKMGLKDTVGKSHGTSKRFLEVSTIPPARRADEASEWTCHCWTKTMSIKLRKNCYFLIVIPGTFWPTSICICTVTPPRTSFADWDTTWWCGWTCRVTKTGETRVGMEIEVGQRTSRGVGGLGGGHMWCRRMYG